MMTKNGIIRLLASCLFLALFSLTCNGNDPLTPPDPPPFDPFQPTIESITAQRDGVAVENDIVYSGEDIDLIVQATSHAFPQSCGLDEGDTVEGNLLYVFKSIPPNDIPAPGLISQASPPDNHAILRVPVLDDYDHGEGLLYIMQVTVLDECLDKQTTGIATLRAFANQGSPVISDAVVESGVGSGSPVTEILDQNGYYEVERGDECGITITAASRTSPEICANRGVSLGDELSYSWSSSYHVINLAYEQDPSHALAANFDIPLTIEIGDTFTIECAVTDECTGIATPCVYSFIVVGKPQITMLAPSANGINLEYNPYFDLYEVRHTDEIILPALGLTMDDNLCDMKGIHPDLEWNWVELNASIPAIVPEFDPLPVPNDQASIEFVVPAALNGTVYNFLCTVNDRCNGLSDSDTASFLVIVPPTAEITSVQRNTIQIIPSPHNGRYEVAPGDLISVRITSYPESDTGFCDARGIDQSPPALYAWDNPWDELLILNYDQMPIEPYSDLVFVVPSNAPPIDSNLTCRITDICNDLSTQIQVPFKVLI